MIPAFASMGSPQVTVIDAFGELNDHGPSLLALVGRQNHRVIYKEVGGPATEDLMIDTDHKIFVGRMGDTVFVCVRDTFEVICGGHWLRVGNRSNEFKFATIRSVGILNEHSFSLQNI